MAFGEPLRKSSGGFGQPLGSAGSSFGKALSGGSGDPESEVADLEALAQESGARQYASGPLGWAQRVLSNSLTQGVLDLASRGNYAVAGAVDEAVNPESGAAASPYTVAKRVARELLSGIGEIHGEKRAFGEVMERSGVPLGPSFSEGSLTRGLYNETGEGWRLKRHGLLDPSLRGIGGVGLDIVTDPLNLVSMGMTGAVRKMTKEGLKVFSRAGARAVAREVAAILPKAAIDGERVAMAALPESGRALAESVARKQAQAGVEEVFRGPANAVLAERTAAVERLAEALHSSPAFHDAVDREAGALLSGGFAKGSPEYKALTIAVAEEAKDRIIAAAATSPGLLDRGGLKFAGMTIPGTPRVLTATADVSAAAIEKLGEAPVIGSFVMGLNKTAGAAYNALGRAFSRDWITRNFPYYNALKQGRIDAIHFRESEILGRIAGSDDWRKLMKFRGEGRATANRRIVEAAEAGDWTRLAAHEQGVAKDLRQIMDDMAVKEYEIGILDAPRANYVAHFYDNTRSELDTIFGRQPVVQVWRGKKIDMGGLGRHNEIRTFDTLKEADDFAAHLKGRPGAPKLVPVWDPVEIVARRAHAHANSYEWNKFYNQVADQIPEGLGFEPGLAYELTRPPMGKVKLSAPEVLEYQKLTDAVRAGGTRPALVKGLSGPAKEEFFRQRFLKASSRQELAAIANKYHDFREFFPKMLHGAETDMQGRALAEVNVAGLHGVPIPQEIAQDIAEMPWQIHESLKPLVAGFDHINNTFKNAVTVLFPAFHVRNAYNNVTQAFLDVGVSAFSPKLHIDTAKILAGKAGLFASHLGAEYSFDDLRLLANKLRVVDTGETFAMLMGKRPAIERGVVAKVRGATSVIENEARLQLWLNYIRRGDDPLQAAERMKSVLFDYHNLSEAEKMYARRLIPFYSWQRKNLQYQIQKLMTRPGRVAAEIKPFRGRASEDEQMTSWEGNAFKLRLDGDGKSVHVLTGIDLPIRNLDMLWNGSLQGTIGGWWGMVTPLLKAPTEIAAGRAFFTGRDLTRQDSNTIGRGIEAVAPQALKQWLGYDKKLDAAGRPTYTFDGERFYLIFQSWALSRLVSTTDRQWKTLIQSPDSWPAFIDVITGLRDKELNLSEEHAKKLLERKRELERLLVRQGKLGKGTYTFKPKAVGQ